MLKETWLYALLLLLPLAFDPAEKISNRLPDASDSTVTEKHFTEKNFAGVAPYSNHEGCPNSKIPPGAAPAFPKLIKEDHTYEYPPKKKLPRLAVVTVAFGTSANNYRGELSAIACYCALHGLPFYVEHVQLQPDRYFSFSKTRAVMKYLPHFEWILYIDNDCVIVNRTRSLEEFIDDNYDLVLQKRDSNHEVHAAVFFVKNSPYGWYFMRKWIALSDNGEAPFNMGDNAALVVLSLLELKPEGHERCLQIIADSKTETDSRVRRKNYNSEFLDCYASLMRNVDIYAVSWLCIHSFLYLRLSDSGKENGDCGLFAVLSLEIQILPLDWIALPLMLRTRSACSLLRYV